MKIIPETSRVH